MKTSNALRMIAKSISRIANNEQSDMDSTEQEALLMLSEQIEAVAKDIDEAEQSVRSTVAS